MYNLCDIKGVGPATVKKLGELDLRTPADVLNFLPKKYIDLKSPVNILETENGQFCVVNAEILKVSEVNFKHKGSFSIKAKSGNAVFKILYFNQPYLKNNFKENENYLFLGKVQFDGASRVMFNPISEKVLPDGAEQKLSGIFTVYPTRGILSQNTMKKIAAACANGCSPETMLDDEFCKAHGISTLKETYSKIHFPETVSDAESARDRLALEDVVNNIIFYRIFKSEFQKPRKVFYNFDKIRIDYYKKAIFDAFGFFPTDSQTNAVEEIAKDLGSEILMNRIVVGDVGSGKTAVAFYAALCAAKSGLQAALIAPTEILAKQHYENFLKLGAVANVKAALLTASTPKSERIEILRGLKDGSISFVAGTHSLLNSNLDIPKLSLVIFDEQQRFGVAQRDALERKALQGADVLVLTATPIPRTLALMFYGNLNVSTIEKRADARTDIKTRIIDDGGKRNMFSFCADECKVGKKVLFVCPMVFDSEGMTVYSAENLLKELKTDLFKNISLGIIHGKMKSEEKLDALRKFRDGETSALIATSVIEVGIDIPDIRYIAVLNSDNFGLSQLHQLRGRAGRDGKEAYCFLHTAKSKDKAAVSRLSAVADTLDGFEIARKDFELRGGGDFLGLCQSGDTLDSRRQLKIDAATIAKAKTISDELFSNAETGNNTDELLNRVNAFDFSRYFASVHEVTNN